MMEYQLHPLCTFFPRMDEKTFNGLVADIQANGLNLLKKRYGFE